MVVKDELATEEMRAQKLTDICDQLSLLNDKLLGNLRRSMRPSAVASSPLARFNRPLALRKGRKGLRWATSSLQVTSLRARRPRR